MGLHGNVRAFSLDDLLNFLTASGHDGTLRVFHKDARKTLYLHQGGLYFETSTWAFRLGDALVQRNVITPERLEEALSKQKQQKGKRVGDVLVDLGYTTQEEILAARRHQVEEEIYDLFGWQDAFFEFDKDALPEGWPQRLENPEEFRFDIRSVLMEALRRLDEWSLIRASLPSERRIYRLAESDDAARKVRKALEEVKSRVDDPAQVFGGTRPLAALHYELGLTPYQTKSLVAGLISAGAVRPFQRHELESRFREALAEDLPQALRLYECALETPEFDARGRFMDRVLFGNKGFRAATQQGDLGFEARLRGKRAFEVLLSLFRQGVTCEYVAKEEGRQVTLLLDKSSIALRIPADTEPPDVLHFLLARSPVADTDMSRVRELQRESGQSLRQVLVGGGYVTKENWFRAQKDAVLDAMFGVLLLKRPYVEVKLGARGADQRLDLEVPLLPWLRAEVMSDVRQWETILSGIPSIRGYLQLTTKGEKELKSDADVFGKFDGRFTLEEVLRAQHKPPQEFLTQVYDRLHNGRLEPMAPEGYRDRFEAAVKAGKRGNAIDYCLAAIDSGVELDYYQAQLAELEANEAELTEQSTRRTLRGDLASFSLAEVLQSFHLSKRSGSLRVAVEGDPQRQQDLYFEQGQAYLLTGARDMEEDLEGDLEQELLASGSVTEEQLASAAAQQMKEEVYEMFLWEGAEFEFTADHLPPEFYSSAAHRKIRLNTVQFLMGAIQRQTAWEEVRQVLPSDKLVLQFVSTQAKMDALTEKGAEDLLLLVDGRHPIADLVRISGIRLYRAMSVLAELVREGKLQEVDVHARREADEDAIVATDLPTSGVLEEGFVGQLQFLGTLQDMSSEKLTGVLRLTDGRRSKEMALVEGVPYRTSGFHPRTPPPEEEYLARCTEDAAQDVAECFSWNGARFELLVGTLPPRLEDPEQREPLRLDPDRFFDTFAEAAERWGMVAELIPREKCLGYVSDEAKTKAAAKASATPELVEMVDGKNSPEDIARISGLRYLAMCWLVELFEEELVEVVDPPESGEDEDEWDFSL